MNDLIKYFDQYDEFKELSYVADKIKSIPSKLKIKPVDLNYFLENARKNKWELIYSVLFYKKNSAFSGFYKINEVVYCKIDGDPDNEKNKYVIFYFSQGYEKQLRQLIDLDRLILQDTKKYVHLLVADGHGHEFVPFEIKPEVIDFNIHYNDDFVEFHKKVLSLSQKDEKGIILLHGKPGTGKTNYIKYLSTQIDRKFLFITSGMGQWIGSSDFNCQLQENPNAVLIIEDAETVLGEQNNNRKEATSNLLNLTDGILSDCFNILVICTFNTSLSKIDEALLRPGRLKAHYEFRELTADKVKHLTNGKKNQEMTIASIFEQSEKTTLNQTCKIGFNLKRIEN
ncbi:MAG: AAA family ATPase [Crocinitomicaceae bacterium]